MTVDQLSVISSAGAWTEWTGSEDSELRDAVTADGLG
jgi:hypothetical protein